MSRIAQKILVLPVAFSFIYSSILCCCLSQPAHAEDPGHQTNHSVQTSESNHCESHSPQDDHSDKTHNCECPKLQGVLAKNFEIIKATGTALHSLNYQRILDKIYLAFVPDNYNSLIGHSPPQFFSPSIHLYIKNPTLRI